VKLTDALDRFLVQLEADGRSSHTIGQYRRHIRLLAAWLAGDGHSGDLAAIDHGVLARFLASPAAKNRPDGNGKRATAMNCLRSSVRTFFGYAHRTGMVASNPAAVVKRARCGNPPPRSLSDGDREKLLSTLAAAAGPDAERDRVLFGLMLATGIRLGSALALDAADVDLDRGELTLRSTKGDHPEVVLLGEAIREPLRRYLESHPAGLLFGGRDGKPLSPRHAERRFRQWLTKAGITRAASPHSLRHSFATSLYQKTGDILLVKEALRHQSIASTLIYAQMDRERLRKALL